jgi:hypothetical protein
MGVEILWILIFIAIRYKCFNRMGQKPILQLIKNYQGTKPSNSSLNLPLKSQIQNPQAPESIRGVNRKHLKSQISNPLTWFLVLSFMLDLIVWDSSFSGVIANTFFVDGH